MAILAASVNPGLLAQSSQAPPPAAEELRDQVGDRARSVQPSSQSPSTRPTRRHRFVLGVNAGAQALSESRTDILEFEQFAETGSFSARQTIGPEWLLDGGLALRLVGWLGVGLAVSYGQGHNVADLLAEVPHPFFFDFHREASAVAPGLAHEELAVHGQAQIWIPVSPAWRVTVGFGPTYFDAAQEVVTAITAVEIGFPFDDAEVTPRHTQRVRRTDVGYHVSVDVAYFGLRQLGFLSRFETLDHVGLGFLSRYSRGAARVSVAGAAQPELTLGGLHLTGGIRVGF